MQALVDEFVNLSRAFLWHFAVSEPSSAWLLMCYNLPHYDPIAVYVSLQTSFDPCALDDTFLVMSTWYAFFQTSAHWQHVLSVTEIVPVNSQCCRNAMQ